MKGLMNSNLDEVLARMLTTLNEKVHTSHTALIIVDMQNDWCAKGGALDLEGFDLAAIQSMVSNLTGLLNKARETGIAVLHVRSIYNSDNNWYLSDVILEQANRRAKGRYVKYPVCREGSWGADFYDGMTPCSNEVVITKHRPSAFINTDLDSILRTKRIRTLIVTGVVTNVCVQATVMDGSMMDYYVLVVRDCVAGYSREMHNYALENMAIAFGEIVNSKDIVNCWKSSDM